MTKLLLLLVLVFGLMWWLRGSGRGRQPPKPPARDPAAPPPAAPAAMLACAHCGLHLPQADAFFDASGRPYCSSAHLLAGPAA